MAHIPIIDADSLEKPVARTTVSLRHETIPLVDAVVTLYRQNSGGVVTRSTVVNKILTDVYNDYVAEGMIK